MAGGHAPADLILEGNDWLESVRSAPSAHNTQPWQFSPLQDGSIAVSWRASRSLPVSDPSRRDLYVAMGGAVESARLGSGGRYTFHPAVDWSGGTVGRLVRSEAGLSQRDEALACQQQRRQTARVAHLDRPVPRELVAEMQQEAAAFGCTLLVVQDRLRLSKLASLARRATADQFADAAVHAELWQWLRLYPSDPAYRRDGLTADCLNLSGASLAIARLTMPPPRMRRLVRMGLHHILALDTQRLVAATSAMCLLMTTSPSAQARIESGRALVRSWLAACAAGCTTHPVSALLDSVLTHAAVLRLFGAESGSAAAIFRLGFTPPVPRAPRLPAAELLDV